MKIVKYIIITCMLFCVAAYSEDKPGAPEGKKNDKRKSEERAKPVMVPTEFYKLLKLAHMKFRLPADFDSVEVDVEKCRDVNYCHALKHRTKKLEVRYVIIPYHSRLEKSEEVIEGSDVAYKISSSSIITAIAGNESNVIKTVEFRPADVKEEFNADWGASSVVRPESGFGSGYKLAVITSLYRDFRGEAYIIFLFDSYKDVTAEYNSAFYSLLYTQ